jgi:hypothetical protein
MSNVSDPAKFGGAVTPSDSTVLTPTRALYVGTAGNVSVLMMNGVTVTFSNVQAGILPIQVTQVLATGTTASNIIALW